MMLLSSLFLSTGAAPSLTLTTHYIQMSPVLYLSGLPEIFWAQNSLSSAKPRGKATSGLKKYVLGRMLVITCAKTKASHGRAA